MSSDDNYWRRSEGRRRDDAYWEAFKNRDIDKAVRAPMSAATYQHYLSLKDTSQVLLTKESLETQLKAWLLGVFRSVSSMPAAMAVDMVELQKQFRFGNPLYRLRCRHRRHVGDA